VVIDRDPRDRDWLVVLAEEHGLDPFEWIAALRQHGTEARLIVLLPQLLRGRASLFISHRELGELAASSREKVTCALGRMRRDPASPAHQVHRPPRVSRCSRCGGGGHNYRTCEAKADG
jgi:hypothetical protein